MADLENKNTSVEATADKKPEPKKNKDSLFSNVLKFFKECKSELKKIVWFSRKQTVVSTLVVIIAIVVSAIFVSLFDYAFSNVLKLIAELV